MQELNEDELLGKELQIVPQINHWPVQQGDGADEEISAVQLFFAPKPTLSKQINKSMHSTHMHYSNN